MGLVSFLRLLTTAPWTLLWGGEASAKGTEERLTLSERRALNAVDMERTKDADRRSIEGTFWGAATEV